MDLVTMLFLLLFFQTGPVPAGNQPFLQLSRHESWTASEPSRTPGPGKCPCRYGESPKHSHSHTSGIPAHFFCSSQLYFLVCTQWNSPASFIIKRSPENCKVCWSLDSSGNWWPWQHKNIHYYYPWLVFSSLTSVCLTPCQGVSSPNGSSNLDVYRLSRHLWHHKELTFHPCSGASRRSSMTFSNFALCSRFGQTVVPSLNSSTPAVEPSFIRTGFWQQPTASSGTLCWHCFSYGPSCSSWGLQLSRSPACLLMVKLSLSWKMTNRFLPQVRRWAATLAHVPRQAQPDLDRAERALLQCHRHSPPRGVQISNGAHGGVWHCSSQAGWGRDHQWWDLLCLPSLQRGNAAGWQEVLCHGLGRWDG